jgi:hypothetical protein
MATAKLVLDFDTRKFFTGAGAAIISFQGKKDSIIEYELSVTQNNVPLSFPTGTTIKVGLKSSTAPPGTLLVEADCVRGGWGSGSRWFFRLDLSGEALVPLMGKKLDFEVLIEFPDGQRIPSATVQFDFQKNVIA